jgi:S-adenosylmethionine:tRNA ribosyltransferase-isomerase
MNLLPAFSDINIDDFRYDLPDDRIAKFPLNQRDSSKLLIYRDNAITESTFKNIVRFLPEDSFLVMNDTKVVQARLIFKKETGALIEIFCLEPVSPTSEIQMAFQQKGSATWKCLVGNARRWKEGSILSTSQNIDNEFSIRAEKIEKSGEAYLIRLSWEPEELTFSEVLEMAGKVPLPPYLNREAVEADKNTYQTVYARFDGSVAAPTAGLHFTQQVFDALKMKRISHDSLTLHVGAGTFKPVGNAGIASHEMHNEQFILKRSTLNNLHKNCDRIIAVGTTSVRTLESLYWLGVRLKLNPESAFQIGQTDPYLEEFRTELPVREALAEIMALMDRKGIDFITGSTRLMIIPGYKFRMISGMVTNFHQPGSTLLLLISAWLGDSWKEIYDYAMKNDFRFLSYGDSCLFLK